MNENLPEPLNKYNDTVRIDRNLYKNLTDIERTYQEDSTLVRDIMIYLAHMFKSDLFGYTSFSLATFCKTMNYNKKNLQKKHPKASDPKERILVIDGNRYDNVFEHTLYQMASKNIILTYTDRTRAKVSTDGVQSVQVLSDIKINFDPKKPDRRLYQVRLGSGFIDNLLSYYVNISLKSYLNVAEYKGRWKKGNLYIYLSGAKIGMIYRKENVLTPNFDMLCNLADISAKEPKHRKPVLKRYLDEIAEQTDLNFSVMFYQGRGQNEAYSIKLIFNDLPQSEGATEKVFFDKLFEKLLERFNKSFPEYRQNSNYSELFQKWLTNRDYDWEAKKECITSAKNSTRQTVSGSWSKSDEVILNLLEVKYLSNLKDEILIFKAIGTKKDTAVE